ncbi:hypothetical protein OB919_09995 [Halobacteria archaeon AArc-curdl1]|uniref:Uncharacterized protein n=1 Tax=Natronosalvus hydrolyticus TaxID=2979988 RepID=A0AAP2ZAB2_9EURY|nr:hypothetical protein [Halobacteria archaeon AArc-curdl1]
MAPKEVTVRVNRTGTESLVPNRDAVTLDGPLTIVLEAESSPAHVHCRLGGPLESVGSIRPLTDDEHGDANYYVAPDSPTKLRLDIEPMDLESPLEGTLELVSSYGAAACTIDIKLVPGRRPADIDRNLGQPQRSETEQETESLKRLETLTKLDVGTLGVVVLAAIALGIGITTAFVVGGVAAYLALMIIGAGTVGALAVLLGVIDPPGQ